MKVICPERALHARRQFSAYFGRDTNILSKVRNKVAFHLSREEIEFVYQTLPDNLNLYSF